MSKAREQELMSKLSDGKHNEYVVAALELFNLRLDKHKNTLVSMTCDITRGRAQEARDFIRIFK